MYARVFFSDEFFADGTGMVSVFKSVGEEGNEEAAQPTSK